MSGSQPALADSPDLIGRDFRITAADPDLQPGTPGDRLRNFEILATLGFAHK